MTWTDLTVQQFQELTELRGTTPGQPIDALETFKLATDMVRICHNLTIHQVDSLSKAEFDVLCKELVFLDEVPEWKPVAFVVVDGRRYRFVYDVRQIHAARNMEVKQFSQGGLIPSLHTVAASMVVPQRRNVLRRWVDDVYDATKHEQYAADIRQAPITAVYGSALFFCEVWRQSIEATADFLTSTIPEARRTEARNQLLASCQILAGSIRLPPSPSSSGSRWPRRISCLISSFLTAWRISKR